MTAVSTIGTGARPKSLILTAMIFAVAMTFIDQTIVSIAAPTIQHDLGLSSSGMQWAINAYLLTLAALFAFGGRLADIAGHRKMVVLGEATGITQTVHAWNNQTRHFIDGAAVVIRLII